MAWTSFIIPQIDFSFLFLLLHTVKAILRSSALLWKTDIHFVTAALCDSITEKWDEFVVVVAFHFQTKHQLEVASGIELWTNKILCLTTRFCQHKKTEIQCACQSLDFSPVGLLKCEFERLTSRWSLLNLITPKTVQCQTHLLWNLIQCFPLTRNLSHETDFVRKLRQDIYFPLAFCVLSSFTSDWQTQTSLCVLFSSLSGTFNALLPLGKTLLIFHGDANGSLKRTKKRRPWPFYT